MEEWAKEPSRHFSGEETKVAKECVRGWVCSLTAQGNAKPAHTHQHSWRKMTGNTKDWQAYGVQECQLIQPLWKMTQHRLLEWRRHVAQSLALSGASGDVCWYVHGSTAAMTITWNWLWCYLAKEQINRFFHAMECYRAMKMNGLQLHTAAWVNLNVMLNKSWTHKNTHSEISCVWNARTARQNSTLKIYTFGDGQRQGRDHLKCQGGGYLYGEWWLSGKRGNGVVSGVLAMLCLFELKQWLHECLLWGNSPRYILLLFRLCVFVFFI